MSNDNPKNVWKWLKTTPSLSELCAKYPDEWAVVQRKVLTAYERNRPEGSIEHQSRLPQPGMTCPGSAHRRSRTRQRLDPVLSDYIRRLMIQMAIRNYGLIAASGVKKGVVRFNWLNGYIIKSLLFAEELERKPASLTWFRLMWPCVWQKKRLMPLAESAGIYCFYSRELIEELTVLIGSKSCLEIAAGDGTLARFLENRGVRITATDNRSWKHVVKYPDWVINRDARAALRLYAPEVVICSWPPADNDFERYVFKTRSVQTYVVIGSRYRFATGNWSAYDRQSAFSLKQDKTLSRLVLPPELGAAVYLFQRNRKLNGAVNLEDP